LVTDVPTVFEDWSNIPLIYIFNLRGNLIIVMCVHLWYGIDDVEITYSPSGLSESVVETNTAKVLSYLSNNTAGDLLKMFDLAFSFPL